MEGLDERKLLNEVLKELRETKAMLALLLETNGIRLSDNDETSCDTGVGILDDVSSDNTVDSMGDGTPIVPEEQSPSLIRIFTLNDKFRFRRELFGGNDTAMTDTLNLLSGMDCVDEAVEYLCGKLGWNKANNAVSDFIAVISNYYK